MHLERAKVIEHREVGGLYRLLAVAAPAIGAEVRPGQFVHVRVPNLDGSVLRRPFSVFRADGSGLSILYKSVGRGTRAMPSLKPGDEVSLLGPLGNGFPAGDAPAVPLLVAGGYGVAALYMLARSLARPGILFEGAATAAEILCRQEFEDAGWPVRVAAEDGSVGHKGRVTEILDLWLRHERDGRPVEIYACGPMGMLKAVAERAIAAGAKAWLSMDRHMGCGVGACLTCVQRVRHPGMDQTRWARVCKDGPVFE